MVCLVNEFREIVVDHLQDASQLREKHLFSDRLELTTHSNSDRFEKIDCYA